MRKKLFSMLALLCLTAAGAWAQTTVTWDSNTWASGWTSDVKTHTVDGVTITAGGNAYAVNLNGNLYMYVTSDAANTLTFSAETPITRIEMTKANASTTQPFTPTDGWSVSSDGTTVTWEGTAIKSLVCETCTLTVSKVKFYLEEAAPEPIALAADAAKKVWTLEKMPAGNVVFQVEYEPWTVTVNQTDSGTVTVDAGGVKALDVPTTWKNDDTKLSVADLPGFKASTEDVAKAWDGAPESGWALLIYGFNDNGKLKYALFSNGSFNDNGEDEFTRETVYANSNGYTVFYTAAGGDGVTDNADGTYNVVAGKSITLKATPAEGYELAGWFNGTTEITDGQTDIAAVVNAEEGHPDPNPRGRHDHPRRVP